MSLALDVAAELACDYAGLIRQIRALGAEAKLSLDGIGPSDLDEQNFPLPDLPEAVESLAQLVRVYDELTTWRPFDPSEPLPDSGLLLVTNNLHAHTPSGSMSHMWLVRGVYRTPSGEVQAIGDGVRLRKLTHYRKV